MFTSATSFNGDISEWDVLRVTDMNHMFSTAASFNSDLSKWDVSRVTDLNSMFSAAVSFNGDISKWYVSKCNCMCHTSPMSTACSLPPNPSAATSQGGVFQASRPSTNTLEKKASTNANANPNTFQTPSRHLAAHPWSQACCSLGHWTAACASGISARPRPNAVVSPRYSQVKPLPASPTACFVRPSARARSETETNNCNMFTLVRLA